MFRKFQGLSIWRLTFNRLLVAENLDCREIQAGTRWFSRSRSVPPLKRRKGSLLSKEEYKELMFERARLRRAFLPEDEQKVDETKEDPLPSDVAAFAEDEESESQSESEDMDEEEVLNECTLFSNLLQYEEPEKKTISKGYIPFDASEDDDEYRSSEEEDFTAQWFRKMEMDVKRAKEEERALYPEEEVVVKLLSFGEEKEEDEWHPVILSVSDVQHKPDQTTVLMLRRVQPLLSTKTKLFKRDSKTRETVIDRIDLSDVMLQDCIPVSVQLQMFLDWCTHVGNKVGIRLFEQIKREPLKSLRYIDKLMKLLPPYIDFQQVARTQSNLLLLENEGHLEFGMECIGFVYPSLNDFKERFKMGMFEIKVLEVVSRIGSKLKKVDDFLSVAEPKKQLDLKKLIYHAASIIPNFEKLLDSEEADITSEAVALALVDPVLTKKRHDHCRQNIYSWPEFNLYHHADFTLTPDEIKFRRFCEMYNVTRKLQLEFADKIEIDDRSDFESDLFPQINFRMVDKQEDGSLMNGILPKQFIAMYEAYEVLEQEGLTWTAFLKGLSILSEQNEVGVYAEIHFYEKLRKSRTKNTVSAILRHGLVHVVRMMCREQQMVMENEPTASESPLFEVILTNHDEEIFM